MQSLKLAWGKHWEKIPPCLPCRVRWGSYCRAEGARYPIQGLSRSVSQKPYSLGCVCMGWRVGAGEGCDRELVRKLDEKREAWLRSRPKRDTAFMSSVGIKTAQYKLLTTESLRASNSGQSSDKWGWRDTVDFLSRHLSFSLMLQSADPRANVVWKSSPPGECRGKQAWTDRTLLCSTKSTWPRATTSRAPLMEL